MLREQFRRLTRRRPSPLPVLRPGREPRGRVLYSYLPEPLTWGDHDPRLQGHSNRWESREIAKTFVSEGLEVIGLGWADPAPSPAMLDGVTVLFDIHSKLGKIGPNLPEARKLLHLTGSYGPFQNQAEERRLQDLADRRGTMLTPRRRITDLDEAEASLELADACSLIGNQFVLDTYPKRYHPKITLVTVSASQSTPKTRDKLMPPEREFLWLFGGGAVHKGLDLVLDVFAANPDLALNVVGGVEAEEDFFNLYRRELTQLPNVRLHGYLNPASREFQEIAARCFSFIAPSCSESISAAVVTCLHIGLYPVVSRQTGVDLPKGCGIYLERCTTEEIESAARKAYKGDEQKIQSEIEMIQKSAQHQYSRARFRELMRTYLHGQLEGLK